MCSGLFLRLERGRGSGRTTLKKQRKCGKFIECVTGRNHGENAMKKTLLWFNLIIGALVLILSVLAIFLPFRYKGSTYKETLDARKGWFYADSDGKTTDREADISALEFGENGKVTVTYPMQAGGLAGGDLCFISTNVRFWIYMNDELVYSFDPDIPKYAGTSSASTVHEVNMPYFDGDSELRMDVEIMAEGMKANFDRAYFQNSAQFMKNLLGEHFYKLVISFIIFATGFILVVLALAFEFRTYQQIEAISIGVIAMVLAVWSNSGTYMLESFMSDLGMVRLLNYGTLMVLPLPGFTLTLSAVHRLKSKTVWVVAGLVTLNVLIHTVVLAFGLGDYHNTLILTHGVFLVTVVLSIYEIIRAFVKRQMKERSQYVVLITFGIVVCTGIFDLLNFYFGDRSDVARFTRVGLLFFILFLSVYEIGKLIEISRKSSEAELMHRLAHEDGLTGLENRLAFTEYEQELSEKKSGHCLFVQLDINFLKRVNDGYGHVEGDRIIKGAAAVIRDSFGEEGRVFRTGGDEFIAVIEGGAQMELIRRYEKIVADLDQRVVDFNIKEDPPVNLSIAYGMAEYECGSGNPEQKEKLADARMYEHKKWLKSQQEDLLTKKKEQK